MRKKPQEKCHFTDLRQNSKFVEDAFAIFITIPILFQGTRKWRNVINKTRNLVRSTSRFKES